jgi:predicted transcriptional regulator
MATTHGTFPAETRSWRRAISQASRASSRRARVKQLLSFGDLREEDDMTTARDIMTGDATCAKAGVTLADAGRKMRDLDVGALPICGGDNRLNGMITDRDIVVRCVADGGDPPDDAGRRPRRG